MSIKKVLIANRGEIAVRVMRTCRELGVETVALYTKGEEDLPHVSEADYSVCLGKGSLGETYLDGARIIEIAKQHHADAIHPGYGFLSERAGFAREVTKAGIKFIGPAAGAIELMGDKVASKIKMEEIKVPLIPGYHGENQDAAFLKKQAAEIGYPVLIKASAGGGGKGMRIVHSEDEFNPSLSAAKREAKNAFGDDRVLVEKFITNPRHIEIQVLSDQHGNHFHLFERECSIQRRYQKIIEESPSPALSKDTRSQMCQAAVDICKSIKYEGVGTVEFILDEDNHFYFLEMNTRLQVEHPITELVTGVDLVKLQLEVAAGEKIPFSQDDIRQQGHAIELRLYAENPDNQFLPSTGELKLFRAPQTPGVRLDTGYRQGNCVTIDFDPMIAKLIVSGSNREHAILRAIRAIEQMELGGVETNLDYLARILEHQSFKNGETFTHFVETHKDELGPRERDEFTEMLSIAVRHFVARGSSKSNMRGTESENTRAWDQLAGFRNGPR